MTGLELHLACGLLRGDTPNGWQSCRCQPAVAWRGTDVSEVASLCELCARGLAGGPGKFSWLACQDCRTWEVAVRKRLGGMLLPIGRHSVMNGVAVKVTAPVEQREKGVQMLVDLGVGWSDLGHWGWAEFLRLSTAAEFTRKSVPYGLWADRFPASAEASRDAYLRLRGVDPSWVVHTFPPRP